MLTALGDGAVLLAVGLLAGLVGSAGGITSLVSYPALLAVGLPPLSANVTNIVAGAACWPGAALASGPELAGRGPWLRRWVPLSVVGGAVGAVLLLVTGSGAFARVVPFLVAAGALVLLAQPWLAARRRQPTPESPGPALPLGLVAVSVYSGYFGAGAGIMTLALLLVTAEPRIATANALKNMLIGPPTLVSAAVFVILAPVVWTAVVPLGVGMFVGSTLGPRVARRLPATGLRWLVALFGLGLAVRLWVGQGG